jgi:hypothetical protein
VRSCIVGAKNLSPLSAVARENSVFRGVINNVFRVGFEIGFIADDFFVIVSLPNGLAD